MQELKVEFPSIGLLTMPLDLVVNIFAGAPTPLWAIISFSAWAVMLTYVISWSRRRSEGRSFLQSCLYAGGAGFCALMVVGTYVNMVLLVHFPGYRLVKTPEASDVLIADLQSHTIFSHDSFVTPLGNLAWHRQRGFDVVAITDHKTTDGALAAMKDSSSDPSLPAVVTGLEISLRHGHGFICVLGADPDKTRGMQWPREIESSIALAKQAEAAVIALEYKLTPGNVQRLLEAGVDGFDVINFGHPVRRDDVSNAIIESIQEKGLVAVGWTDWHGWGGFSRVWTAVRVPGAADLGREEAAKAVVNALKDRRSEDVVPIVAGRLGRPSNLRVITAPAWELFRYASELSAAQVFALWAWTGFFLAVSFLLAKTGLNPLRTLTGTYAIIISLVSFYGSFRIIWLTVSGAAPFSFPMQTGLIGIIPSAWTLWTGIRMLQSHNQSK